MATIAEQLTSLANTKAAIKQSIIDKGVQVADTDPFSAYPAKIGQISGGGAPATKFGVSIDNLLGNVDAYGMYIAPTEKFEVDFSGITKISSAGLHIDGKFFDSKTFDYAFYKNTNLIGTVDLSNIEYTGIYSYQTGMESCFFGTCIEKIILPAYKSNGTTTQNFNSIAKRARLLKTVVLNSDMYDIHYVISGAFSDCESLVEIIGLDKVKNVYNWIATFEKCTSLPKIDVSRIETISGSGFSSTFSGCTSLAGGVYFDCLKSIAERCLNTTFRDASLLTEAYFPSLTVAPTNSFGTYSGNETFHGCTGIVEIHFRKDAQSVIEALQAYSTKFGATNATIYFDLIGTITVNGVAYSRDEPNSIRADGNKTFVAWKDASNNIVYTDATAEPAVGTVVYSDQGTTQVGTVSEVA